MRSPRNSKQRSAGKRLGLEQLETRNLMAGNVMVNANSQVLEIVGDAAANSIAVTFNAQTNKFEVHGLATTDGNTTINGFNTSLGGNTQSFANVKHVRVRLNAGDDQVTLGTAANPNVDINGWLNIQMGAGNDTVIAGQAGNAPGGVDPLALSVDVASHVAVYTDIGNDVVKMANFHTDGNLTVNTGAGDDKFFMPTAFIPTGGTAATNFPVAVDGNFGLQTGAGNDEVVIANLTASGDLRIRDTSGISAIDLRSSYAGRTVEVQTGAQADEILLDGVTSRFVTVNTGSGNDIATLRHVNARRLGVSLQAGNDKLTLGSVDVSQYTLLDGGAGNDLLVNETGNQLRGKIARSFS
jgi:hypothetical protein